MQGFTIHCKMLYNRLNGGRIMERRKRSLQLRKNKIIKTLKNLDNEELFKLVFEDSLTKFFNRNYYMLISKTLARRMIMDLQNNIQHKNDKGIWSVMFCDVDNLKTINDEIGHEAGNKGIETIVGIVEQCIRYKDNPIVKDNIIKVEKKPTNNMAFRIGGDEFVIILPNCTKDEALLVKRRINEQIKNNKNIINNMTLAIGIADTSEVLEDMTIDKDINVIEFFQKLVGLADERMYIEKNKDVRLMSYDEQSMFVFKKLSRVASKMGLNLNNQEDFEYLKQIINRIELHIKEETKKK